MSVSAAAEGKPVFLWNMVDLERLKGRARWKGFGDPVGLPLCCRDRGDADP